MQRSVYTLTGFTTSLAFADFVHGPKRSLSILILSPLDTQQIFASYIDSDLTWFQECYCIVSQRFNGIDYPSMSIFLGACMI